METQLCVILFRLRLIVLSLFWLMLLVMFLTTPLLIWSRTWMYLETQVLTLLLFLVLICSLLQTLRLFLRWLPTNSRKLPCWLLAMMKTLIIKIYLHMSNKSVKAGNWLKAIAAVISFIAGLITGGNTNLVDNFTNFIQ